MALTASKGKRRQKITYTDGYLFNQRSINQAASLDSTDEKSQSEPNKIITVQVGERTFETFKSTLTKSPYFEALLADNFGDKQSDGSYFIDRNGNHFEYLLDFLRCGYVEIPSDKARTIQMEAQYYQIPMDFSEVSRRFNLQPVHVTIGEDLLLGYDGKCYPGSEDPYRDREWAEELIDILINEESLWKVHKVYCLNKEECINMMQYDCRGSNYVLSKFRIHILQHNEYEITVDNMAESCDEHEFYMRPRIPRATFMITNSPTVPSVAPSVAPTYNAMDSSDEDDIDDDDDDDDDGDDDDYDTDDDSIVTILSTPTL